MRAWTEQSRDDSLEGLELNRLLADQKGVGRLCKIHLHPTVSEVIR